MDLDRLFAPERVAVIGVASRERHPSRDVLRNLRQAQDVGVVAVGRNLRPGDLDVETCRSVLDLPDGLDVAVVLVPGPGVQEVLVQCAQRGVGFAIVESEVSDAHSRRLATALPSLPLRLLGPNCLGVVNGRTRLATSFIPLPPLAAGGVGLVAQTGMVCGGLLQEVHDRRLFGVSKVASLGSMLDVRIEEVVDHLADDDGTTVIGLYVEGLEDGRALYEAVDRAARSKPVVLVIGGLTDAGANLAASHTGRLAAEGPLVRAVLGKAGALVADEFSTWVNACAALSRWPGRPAGRVAVVSTSGGASVVALDILRAAGLRLATLADSSRVALARRWGDVLRADNPVDIEVALERFEPPEVLAPILDVLDDDAGVDAVLVVLGLFRPEVIAWQAVPHPWRKPVIAWVYGRAAARLDLDRLWGPEGILRVATLREAAQVLATLQHRARSLEEGR